MRALTLNAHVTQFAYDPLGIEIATVGLELSGSRVTGVVKTLDARTGHEISRLVSAASTDSGNASYALLGWSKSGKSLLLRQLAFDTETPDFQHTEYLRWDLGADPPKAKVLQPQLSLPPDIQGNVYAESTGCYPSPTGRWFMFTLRVRTHTPEGKHGPDTDAAVLYDPDRDTFRPLMLPSGFSFASWSNATQINICKISEKFQQFDFVAGQTSPVAKTQDSVPVMASQKYSDLSVEIDHQELQDSKKNGGRLGINIIWIRRTPFGKMPLGIACAGQLSPGDALFGEAALASWSPTGKQIACIANGEICIADLAAVTEPIPSEKLSVGLKLSCEEERELAISSMKQIGLGILQYCQDCDEKYPPGEGFIETIQPYVKSRDLFQVGTGKFVYEQPTNLSMAAMEEPAQTEMGYMDLPCARVVLFCDGHVKVFPK